ncbi:MAG: tRNA pseudouridine synthase [Bacteriovoracaceae bacterium]|nr:tRNA pseudouridine synthase [Bacteriovoracaceae bacterium]
MKKSSLKKQESHLGFRVSYDGTSFQGFQSQSNSKSIQQWIEKAFSIFFRQEIKIQFTSRTDSGVHAYDQIVVLRNGHSLYSALQLSEQKRLLYSLNALLKGRVCVWKVFRLKADFNPKSDIDWKEYHYQVHQGPVFDPLMTGTAWWIRSSLNLPLMKEALRQLVGHHDFSAFADKKSSTTKKISSEVVDNCRTILNAQVIVTKHPYINEINTIQFRFRGKGFLYRMVRNMVGVVVGIGRGIPWSAETLLQSKKRPQLLVSAPANGLVLAKTQVASGFVSKLLTIFLFLLLFSHSTEAKDFTGSAAFSVSQRFFDDERLGHVNGFSPWGALQLDVSFGLYEFPFGIEPIV